VTLNCKIILASVTEHGKQQLGLDKNMWPQYVTDVHTNPGWLNCVTCNTCTTQPVLNNVSKSKFLFIEFPPGLMKDINVSELIEITGAQYKLRGVVPCNNNHFTCTVENHSKWTYFDDLCCWRSEGAWSYWGKSADIIGKGSERQTSITIHWGVPTNATTMPCTLCFLPCVLLFWTWK